jgi:alanyl-tRNA synthetase
VVEGGVSTGERAKAMVNAVRRHQTACNHTATHLLHNALRLVLGDGVRQAGSAVRQEKLRFDYTTRRAPTTDELRHIEELVNRRIVENHPVRPFVTTREYAAELGALAFFEEK